MDLAVHPVDIAVAAILLFAAIQGFRRGLTAELARIAGVVAALVVAWLFYPAVGQLLLGRTRLSDGAAAYALAFVLLFALGALAMIPLRLLFRIVVDLRFKKWIEKLGGVVTGLCRSALVLAVFIVLVSLGQDGYLREQVAENSLVGSTVSTQLTPCYERLVEIHPHPGVSQFEPEEVPADPHAPDDSWWPSSQDDWEE